MSVVHYLLTVSDEKSQAGQRGYLYCAMLFGVILFHCDVLRGTGHKSSPLTWLGSVVKLFIKMGVWNKLLLVTH